MKQHTMGRMELAFPNGDSLFIHLGKDEQAKCYNLTLTWGEGSDNQDQIYTYGLSEQDRAVNNYLTTVRKYTGQ